MKESIAKFTCDICNKLFDAHPNGIVNGVSELDTGEPMEVYLTLCPECKEEALEIFGEED